MLKFVLAAIGLLAASPAFAGIASFPPVNPIPEPVSMSLLAIGVGGVAAARALRNRKK